jgi:hypothetical protein
MGQRRLRSLRIGRIWILARVFIDLGWMDAWLGLREEGADGRRGEEGSELEGYSSELSREAVHRVGTGRECLRVVWTRGGWYVTGGGEERKIPNETVLLR